MTKNLRD